jgi:hypothetical protein
MLLYLLWILADRRINDLSFCILVLFGADLQHLMPMHFWSTGSRITQSTTAMKCISLVKAMVVSPILVPYTNMSHINL